MASSSDAVRNFVYDFHRHNLRQAWQINQQLEQKQLDSWERLHEAYRVKDPNSEVWDVADEACVAAFEHTCPLLGHGLAAQLLAQATLFMKSSEPQALRRGNSGRLGSLRQRIDRLYLGERASQASRSSRLLTLGLQREASYHQAGTVPKTSRLVPFWEAVRHPGFPAVAE